MKRKFLLALLVTEALVLTTPASARTHQVSDLKTFATIVGETAEAGDIIELQPGTYFLEADRISVR